MGHGVGQRGFSTRLSYLRAALPRKETMNVQDQDIGDNHRLFQFLILIFTIASRERISRFFYGEVRPSTRGKTTAGGNRGQKFLKKPFQEMRLAFLYSRKIDDGILFIPLTTLFPWDRTPTA